MTALLTDSCAEPEAAPGSSLGTVTLTVADLGRSLACCCQVIGLRVLKQSEGRALLGAGTTGLILLPEEKGATPSVASRTGLHHLALLLPSRADLGRFVAHLMAEQMPIQGRPTLW